MLCGVWWKEVVIVGTEIKVVDCIPTVCGGMLVNITLYSLPVATIVKKVESCSAQM